MQVRNNELFLLAFQLHQSGRIPEAINHYETILTQEDKDAQLLYLIGTAYIQMGSPNKGIELIRRSLVIDADNPDALNSLAIALKGLKHYQEALDCYNKAIATRPDYAEAYKNRGRVLRELGRLDEALASFDKAIACNPDDMTAYSNRCGILHDLKRFDQAVVCYDKVLAFIPDNSEVYNNRGIALQELRRFDDALESYDQVLAINPYHSAARNNRGVVLKELGRINDALVSFDNALSVDPENVEAYNNRGVALLEHGRIDEALACFDKALTIRPDHAEGLYHRGMTLQALLRIDEALASYDKALAVKPDYADAYLSKSFALLLTGDYLQGWALYEWRTKTSRHAHNYYPGPQAEWRGEINIRGKRLLVYSEQGLGDTIQFARYLPLLHEMGIELIVAVPKPLVNLMSTMNCPMTLVEKGDMRPEFDACCPLMSLPYVLKTQVATIPADTPYLFSTPDRFHQLKSMLGGKTAPRIGLAWSGSEQHINDSSRSMKLAQMLPLINLDNIEWHSLQKEYRPTDAETLIKYPNIQQHQDHLLDFADTAALIECMDLVISVDTSIAHLAGALGIPTLILLPFSPDYRWLLGREDSPWYPTARLSRQPRPNDWDHVISSIRNDLQNLPLAAVVTKKGAM